MLIFNLFIITTNRFLGHWVLFSDNGTISKEKLITIYYIVNSSDLVDLLHRSTSMMWQNNFSLFEG